MELPIEIWELIIEASTRSVATLRTLTTLNRQTHSLVKAYTHDTKLNRLHCNMTLQHIQFHIDGEIGGAHSPLPTAPPHRRSTPLHQFGTILDLVGGWKQLQQRLQSTRIKRFALQICTSKRHQKRLARIQKLKLSVSRHNPRSCTSLL